MSGAPLCPARTLRPILQHHKEAGTLDQVIRILWNKVRKTPQSSYVSIEVLGQHGWTDKIGLYNETHGTTILPRDAAEIAQLNATRDADKQAEPRKMCASLVFRKYNGKVEEGQVDNLPETSDYYAVMEIIAEYFLAEGKRMKREGKLTDDRKEVKAGGLYAPSVKLTVPVQTHVQSSRSKEVGKELTNPIARLPLRPKKDTGSVELRTAFFDAQKPIMKDVEDPATHAVRKVHSGYEALLVDGQQVDDTNIHRAIPAGSKITGMVRISICLSNMSTGLVLSCDRLIVEQRCFEKQSLADMMAELALGEGASPGEAAASTDAASTAAAATSSAAANVQANDDEDFLADI